MKSQIVESLETRLKVEISQQNPLRYLKQYSVEDYFDVAVSALYMYTRP